MDPRGGSMSCALPLQICASCARYALHVAMRSASLPFLPLTKDSRILAAPALASPHD